MSRHARALTFELKMAAMTEGLANDDDVDELFALAELDDLDDFDCIEENLNSNANSRENVNVFENAAAPVAKNDNKHETRNARHTQLKQHLSNINSVSKRKVSLDKTSKNNHDQSHKVTSLLSHSNLRLACHKQGTAVSQI